MTGEMQSHTPCPVSGIKERIHFIRRIHVMLDMDLAMLYQVETKALKQAVKRNIERFPEDFMFELSSDEFKNLRSQFVTSSWGIKQLLEVESHPKKKIGLTGEKTQAGNTGNRFKTADGK